MKGDQEPEVPETGADASWHQPVLLQETIEMWYRPGGLTFVDGTVGMGGHTAALLSRVPGARVLGIDRDSAALERARENLAEWGDRVVLQQGSYATLDEHLEAAGFPPQVDGILLDLGLGSHQLEAAARGFSFRFDGPLDMRFDQNDSALRPASVWLVESSESELAQLLKRWGEEPQAKRIARTIVKWREDNPLDTTGDLIACIDKAVPPRASKRGGNRDVWARCFQALRIAVNEELAQLDTFLEGVPGWLATGGRIALISFHSLEDRRTKHQLREWAQGCVCPPDFPICACGRLPLMRLLHRKGIVASEEESQTNPRARSARLRGAERTEAAHSERGAPGERR